MNKKLLQALSVVFFAIYVYPKINFSEPLKAISLLIGEAVPPLAIAVLCYLILARRPRLAGAPDLFLRILCAVLLVAMATSLPLIFT